jgi:hypothetical protein
VPTRDGDSFEVVLGHVLTLVRSEEASLEQESPLVVEPVLIEGEPSHISISSDGQPFIIVDGAITPESRDS